jgi:glycerophosphoryl diester phosphodiesterase
MICDSGLRFGLDGNKKLIVAHRGDRTRAGENTLEAFQDAIESGADMIEFDVRRMAGGRIVVHHDPLPASGPGDHVPLLSEVLELTAGRIQLDVELKETGYEQDVLRLIFDHGFSVPDFVVTSFWPDAVTAIGKEARAGLLVEKVTWPEAIDLYHRWRPNFLAPHYTIVGFAAGIPLLPWTVNDTERIRELLARPDVFGVITDRPRDALHLTSGSRTLPG